MAIAGRRIFISGGAGFIGTQLAKRLIDENEIIVYDNLHRDALRYSDLLQHPNFRLIEGDVLNIDLLKESIQDVDYIVHLAAIAGVDTVRSMPIETLKINFLGTMNILETAQKIKGLKRLINFSSSEVFGSHVYLAEEHSEVVLGAVGESRWTYAVSKLAAEHLVYNYYKIYNMPCLTIRPFNVYGPYQVGIGAIHEFIRRAIKNETIEIHGDGTQIRAWCYIDDMIDGIILCLEREEAIGHVFNIGNPQTAITILNLAKMIINLAESESEITFTWPDYTDVELRIPSIEKAKKLLGFKPKFDLETGLKLTIEWYRKHG